MNASQTPTGLRALSLCVLLLATALMRCTDASPPNQAATMLPPGLLTVGSAEGPTVMAVKQNATTGERVTMVGRICGRVRPFVQQRAVFTLVDPALPSCADCVDPDHCATPWDYCCDERARLRAATATIEVVDAAGEPLPIGLLGVQGLDPLVTVSVTGLVTERNDQGLLVIQAERIELRAAATNAASPRD